MTYLLFWYVVFWLMQITVPKYKYIIIEAISIISSFAAPSAYQAQQALSFGIGVFLSDLNEEKKDTLCKQSKIIIVVTFVIGCVAFLIKQFVEIQEMSYEMWVLKLLYRFVWAIMVIFAVYLLYKKYLCHVLD